MEDSGCIRSDKRPVESNGFDNDVELALVAHRDYDCQTPIVQLGAGAKDLREALNGRSECLVAVEYGRGQLDDRTPRGRHRGGDRHEDLLQIALIDGGVQKCGAQRGILVVGFPASEVVHGEVARPNLIDEIVMRLAQQDEVVDGSTLLIGH